MLALLTSTLVIALSTSASPRLDQADLTPEEKVYGLSLYWKEASDHFVFFDKVPELNWDKTYQEYIPKVLATKSKFEYYQLLSRFAAQLHDSHSNVTFPKDATGAGVITPVIGAKTIGDRVFVASILKAMESVIPLKSEITAVEGQSPRQYFDERFLKNYEGTARQARNNLSWALLAKRPGQTVRFTLVTPSGRKKEVAAVCGDSMKVTVTEADGSTKEMLPERNASGALDFVSVPLGTHTVPGPYASIKHEDLGGGIQYVRVDTFADKRIGEYFDTLVPKLASAKGIILDLRSNSGGDDAVGIQIAKNFTKGSFKSFASRSRKVISAYKAWGKWVDPKAPNLSTWQKDVLQHYQGEAWELFPPGVYKGHKDAKLVMPIVVLIGPGTASAAEDSLIYYEDIKNIVTVGEYTFGGTGQPLIFDLPGGGMARVCTQRCTFPDGREFVGPGVKPNVFVPYTGDDFLAGRDSIFEKGLEVLKGRIGG